MAGCWAVAGGRALRLVRHPCALAADDGEVQLCSISQAACCSMFSCLLSQHRSCSSSPPPLPPPCAVRSRSRLNLIEQELRVGGWV